MTSLDEARKIFRVEQEQAAWAGISRPGGVPTRSQELLADMELAHSAARYGAWMLAQQSFGAWPVEHLLPRLVVECPGTLPRLMQHGATCRAETDAALRARVEALAPWGYGIQLRPGVVTSPHAAALERVIFRSHLITATVKGLLGSELGSARVLDLACNHGYFASEIAFEGAAASHGVDLRERNIAKAGLLRDYFGVDNASFERKNIYDVDPGEAGYDVVYNLGLLYHVTNPHKLLQLTYRLCRHFAVVDTITHKEPVSAYIQWTNKNTDSHAEGEYAVELQPTYRAVIDGMHAVGFKDLVEVVAAPGSIPHELYDRRERRCIIGFR